MFRVKKVYQPLIFENNDRSLCTIKYQVPVFYEQIETQYHAPCISEYNPFLLLPRHRKWPPLKILFFDLL